MIYIRSEKESRDVRDTAVLDGNRRGEKRQRSGLVAK